MALKNCIESISGVFRHFTLWLLQERHKERAKQLREDVERAFTEHPKVTGETYFQHLWFTSKMAVRFAFVSGSIIIHGLFPFLCTRTASQHTEQLYRIMKTRVPKKSTEPSDNAAMQPIRIESAPNRRHIAIIGGGFSGAMTLVHIVRLAEGELTIDWFEPNALGEGVAYATKDNFHLLNVRADKMGAFADAPDHFYQWLRTPEGKEVLKLFWPDREVAKESYVPRAVYSAYLKHMIHEALDEAKRKQIIVNIYPTSVVDASLHNLTTQQLLLAFHQEEKVHELVVDAAILATGNLPPRSHGFQASWEAGKNLYIDDVWNPPADHFFPSHVHTLSPDSEVVIIGSGLTTIDTVLTLKHKGYKGRIYAISRNGLMPSAHVPTNAPYPLWEWTHSPDLAPRTAVGLLTRLKREIKQAATQGYHWQSVIDSLRSVTPMIWKQLDAAQKRKFLARLATFWNVHRHRMAPEVAQEIRALMQSGQFNVISGKIYYMGMDNDGATVAYRKRGTNRIETLRPAVILNCTGPEYDIAASHHPLLRHLRDRELVTVGLLRAGIEMTERGTAKGKADQSLFAIGTLRVGECLESTAVPELREQAQGVAYHALTYVSHEG